MKMDQLKRLFVAATLWLAVGLSCHAEDAAKTLHTLLDREWEWNMQQWPTWASSLGDRRWNDQWEDNSLETLAAQHEHQVQLMAELGRIDRKALSEADRLNLDLYKRDLESQIEGWQFHLHLMPITQRDGIQLADELADSLRFETVKDYEDWTARMQRFPKLMAQTIALMKQGIAERIVQPKIVMQRVPAQIDRQIETKPEEHPFFKPFTAFPAGMAEPVRERLKAAALKAVKEQVVPAYKDFKAFFVTEYLPACFDDVGAWQLPRGHDCYAHLARKFTTTTLSPQQIHDIGQGEVKRISGEMEKIQARTGFTGTLAEFFQFLRTDKRFYCASEADVLMQYQATAKRIDPTLVKLFHAMPRMPYGVQAIPAKVAPDTTAAYYREPSPDGSRAGTFFVNLYKPETRPTWEMMTLALHESVPGHHFQIALAQEQGELPVFRRHLHFTAFIEGWALYCESLGDELGLYDDAYVKMGQLSFDMWRAVRLVVDTGMHEFKWSREKSITFFKDHAPRSEQDITNEVDRYIGWPGQALAYKVGQLKIRELRTRAEKALGDAFDVKGFHDVVLLGGALPLDALETRVNVWITACKAKH
ncbi:MAG: hypothetical protein JWO89_1343 [Verrucomicrobiaceae bacterium]|nr:hypothetical protein [Verrucomicrobiaceae bacterium]